MTISLPIESPLRVFANVLTNMGRQIVTGRLKGVGSGAGFTEPIHIAWGSGAGTAAAADTTLFTEEAEARTAGTSTRITTAVTNDTYEVTGTITAVAGKTITNAGLFDVTKAQGGGITGNLFVKGDFAGVALANGDSIAFTFRWQLQ
jgi:hypothetical protein